jgi:hypothetical protein
MNDACIKTTRTFKIVKEKQNALKNFLSPVLLLILLYFINLQFGKVNFRSKIKFIK